MIRRGDDRAKATVGNFDEHGVVLGTGIRCEAYMIILDCMRGLRRAPQREISVPLIRQGVRARAGRGRKIHRAETGGLRPFIVTHRRTMDGYYH